MSRLHRKNLFGISSLIVLSMYYHFSIYLCLLLCICLFLSLFLCLSVYFNYLLLLSSLALPSPKDPPTPFMCEMYATLQMLMQIQPDRLSAAIFISFFELVTRSMLTLDSTRDAVFQWLLKHSPEYEKDLDKV